MTMPQSSQLTADRWIARTLRWGVWTSAVLMTLGLLMQLWRGGTPLNPDDGFLFSDLARWPPTPLTLMYAGLLCLMVTPFLRVATALISFVIEKDWKFAAISSVVLSMLVAELILAFP